MSKKCQTVKCLLYLHLGESRQFSLQCRHSVLIVLRKDCSKVSLQNENSLI